MHAARAQPGEMPLANQQPRRRGLLLLRERASQRTILLPGARAHRVSVGRSTAQQRGCVSDDTTTAALPSSVMNSRLFHQERTFSSINGPGPNGPTFTPISAYAGLSADLRRQLTETKIEPAAEESAPPPPVRQAEASPARSTKNKRAQADQ